MDLKTLDRFEISLIKKFGQLSAFSFLPLASAGEKHFALLQRRFLSIAFTHVFDIAINGITNQKALNIIRDLICEEYPQREPSHREWLFTDLKQAGIATEQILSSAPTSATHDILQQSVALLKLDTNLELHEIKSLAVVRFWGEVLVGEEYGHLRPVFESLGLTKENSKFYWPHFEHDTRSALFSEGRSSGSHSDWLTIVLRELLDSHEKIELFANVEQRIFEIKTSFWRQFASNATEQFGAHDSRLSVENI